MSEVNAVDCLVLGSDMPTKIGRTFAGARDSTLFDCNLTLNNVKSQSNGVELKSK